MSNAFLGGLSPINTPKSLRNKLLVSLKSALQRPIFNGFSTGFLLSDFPPKVTKFIDLRRKAFQGYCIIYFDIHFFINPFFNI